MNINFENKLFQGVIDNSITQESLIKIDNNLYKNPGLLSGKINEYRQRVDSFLKLLYNKADELDKDIISWNSNYPRILAQVEQLESQINDRLFLRSDTEGFYNTLYETFTTEECCDFINSSNVEISVLENCVRLSESIDGSRLLGQESYQISIARGEGSVFQRLVPVNGTSISNLYENNLTGWTGIIVSNEATPTSISILVNFTEPTEVGEIAISFIDSNGSSTLSAIVTDENDSSSVILSQVDIINTNIINIDKVAKKVQIIITKNIYDIRNYQENLYRSIYHIKSLRVYKNIEAFSTTGTFLSKPYPVYSANKFAIETCDFTSDKTKINYYLKLVPLNLFNDGIYVDNLGETSGNNLRININPQEDNPGDLNITKLYSLSDISINNAGYGYVTGNQVIVPGDRLGAGTSPGNDLLLTIGDVGGSGEVINFSAASGYYTYAIISAIHPINKPPIAGIPYGLYLANESLKNNLQNVLKVNESLTTTSVVPITESPLFYNFTNRYKVINSIMAMDTNKINSIKVFANYSELDTTQGDTWNKEGDVYTSWIYMSSDESSYLDPGPSGLIIHGIPKEPRGYHLNKTGWFKVSVPVRGYADLGSEFSSLTQLQEIDPLYPYNGKYLIEGCNLPTSPYKGFKKRAKKQLTQVYNIANLTSNSFYAYKVPATTDGLLSYSINKIPVAIILEKNTDIANGYVEYIKNDTYNAYSVRLIAKLITEDRSQTPVLSSYKIKLGE